MEFSNIVKDKDFVGITETHMHEEILENLSFPGFKCLKYKIQKKNLNSNTASGGIAIFVKDHLAENFQLKTLVMRT